ncbi:uncharacterized protein V6R79_023070 [Siganus canaliculatus]
MLAAIVETTELHFQHVVLSTTSEPVPSTSMVTMDKVYEYIGSTISDAFANVNDDPDCPSTEKITELVAEEVTDRVNVLLSKGSSNIGMPSAGFFTRLTEMVKHFQTMLRQYPLKPWHGSSQAKPRAPAQASGLEAAGGSSHQDHFIDAPSKMLIQTILEEQERQSDGFRPQHMSDADCMQIVSAMFEDMANSMLRQTEKPSEWGAAAVQAIIKEQQLQMNSTKPEHMSDADFMQVMNVMFEDMADSMLHQTVKPSARDAAAVKTILKKGKPQTKSFKPQRVSDSDDMQVVNVMTEDMADSMLHQTEHPSGQSAAAVKPKKQVTFSGDIEKEPVSSADNLHVVVDAIPQDSKELASEITEVRQEVPAVETAPSQPLQSPESSPVPQSNKTSCWRRAARKARSFCSSVGQAVRGFAQKVKRTKNRVHDIGTLSQEVPAGVDQGVEIISTPEQDPKAGTSTEAVAPPDAVVPPGCKWDRVNFKVLTVTLLEQTLTKTSVDTAQLDWVKSAQTLGEKLCAEMSGSVINHEPNPYEIRRIVKEVHKDMTEILQSWEMVQSCLLSDEPSDHELIVDVLNRHLVKKKSATRSFLDGLRKIF